MKTSYPYLILSIFLVCLGLVACGPETSGSETESAEREEMIDEVAPEAEGVSTVAELVPELIGKWKLVNQRVGDMFISPSQIDEPVREFTADGQMIMTTKTSSPHSIEFTYINGVISTLQEGDQLVAKLTADSLVLSEVVDGIEAEYTFVKIP